MKESLEIVKISVFNYIEENKLNDEFDKEAYHLHVTSKNWSTQNEKVKKGLDRYTIHIISIIINMNCIWI